MAEWEVCVEDFNVRLGELRRKFVNNQCLEGLDVAKVKLHDGQFRRIVSRDRPTLLRTAEGKHGVVGYRVPARLVDKQMLHVRGLEIWVNAFKCSLPGQIDEKRNVRCVRRYGHWVKYHKGGELRATADYRRDGEMATRFFADTSLLWSRVGECFPKSHCSRIFRDLTQYGLDAGQERMCGPWTTCAINIAVDGIPVETSPHRDVQGFLHGLSCLCPFGEFRGGGLILWELEAVVELERGDLFFFPDHLITHSNEKVHGLRHSVVAFMEGKTWLWMQRRYGFTDRRVAPLRMAQKRYRGRGKEMAERPRRMLHSRS
jgi:hypothetical protein